MPEPGHPPTPAVFLAFCEKKEMGASQSAYDKEAASSGGGGSEASPASGGRGSKASPAEILIRKDGIIARQKRKSKIDGNGVYFSMY